MSGSDHLQKLTPDALAARAGVAGKTVSRWMARYPWLAACPPDLQVEFLKLPTEEKHFWADKHEAEYNRPELLPPPAVKEKRGGFSLQLPPEFSGGRGLRKEVEALSIACEAARVEWGRLAAAGHHDMAKAFSVYEKLLNCWRQIAKDAPKALQELDDSISKDEAQGAWMAALSSVSKLMDALPVRIVKLTNGLTVAEGIEVAEREIRGIKQKLAKGLAVDGEIVLEAEAKPKKKAGRKKA